MLRRCIVVMLCMPPGLAGATPRVQVGSKKFTESVILGEIAAALARQAGATVRHRRELGGSRILFSALRAGDIDVYPEYTGTLIHELLAGEGVTDRASLAEALSRQGLRISASLGFRNNYAIGMRRDRARRLGIAALSDLARHPSLRLGFSNEFMNRRDGWPGLRDRYGLPQRDVRGMDHDLAYRALVAGTIDAIDLYTTDAEIAYYDLLPLVDDRHYFADYEAVWLYRADLGERAPGVVAALERAVGAISQQDMVRMNARVKLEGLPEGRVAAEFVSSLLGAPVTPRVHSLTERLARRTAEHLYLGAISLGAAVVVALPLGIVAARRPRAGQIILGVVGVIQTIPSLALLVFMIPLLGIGGPPAIVALFLYSLLPIVRNTCTGLRDIPRGVVESAEAMGLPPGARLWRIELPLASRSILAGIKTSAVINVGTATLGALIGAGGYGQPILTGIRLDDVGLILEGAVPAALLALLVQVLFDYADRWFVPLGLRLESPPAGK